MKSVPKILSAVLLLVVLSQCATSQLGSHGKIVVKPLDLFPNTKAVYYQPADTESELTRNLQRFLTQNNAKSMTCVYTGTTTKSRDLGNDRFDPTQKGTAIVSIEKTFPDPFCQYVVSYANGTKVSMVDPNIYLLYVGGDSVLKGNGEVSLSMSEMIHVLPIVRMSASDSTDSFSVRPNASTEWDPVTQQRVSCALFQTSGRAQGGTISTKAWVSDDVPGRILKYEDVTHDLQRTSLALSKVIYH